MSATQTGDFVEGRFHDFVENRVHDRNGMVFLNPGIQRLQVYHWASAEDPTYTVYFLLSDYDYAPLGQYDSSRRTVYLVGPEPLPSDVDPTPTDSSDFSDTVVSVDKKQWTTLGTTWDYFPAYRYNHGTGGSGTARNQNKFKLHGPCTGVLVWCNFYNYSAYDTVDRTEEIALGSGDVRDCIGDEPPDPPWDGTDIVGTAILFFPGRITSELPTFPIVV